MSDDLHDRATAVFGRGPDGIRWPYDVSGIDYRLKRTDPGRYRRDLEEITRKRELIVGWAERYGLKASPVHCCPWWLTRRVSRRCTPGRCTRYGTAVPDHDWMDHSVFWLKDGRPAVITSAPYHLGDEDAGRIAWWTGQHTNLRSARGTGWYGFGTTQILMWRADRIAAVEPCAGTP